LANLDMQIVCPNCQTAYGVTLAALGPDGRNVRCAKCKEVWHARPEEAVHAHAMTPAASAEGGATQADESHAAESWSETEAPHVESPSIAPGAATETAEDWSADIRRSDASDDDAEEEPRARRRLWRPRFGLPQLRLNLSVAVAAMAALIAALIIWRTDVVRLLPQTASLFKLAGITVNLRNLTIEDVRVSTETVNGAPVTVIEGNVASTSFKPVEIPRLRFVVRDAHGTQVYAWNTVLDQAVVNPGEKVAFKSRLASPPPNAYDLIVRFFNKRDLLSGGA
jgi:predicted Zn finger-like uncharacterized protein